MFSNPFKRKTTTFVLMPTTDGRFSIVNTSNVGISLGTYTRKRDAVRGAARKGITLTNA